MDTGDIEKGLATIGAIVIAIIFLWLIFGVILPYFYAHLPTP